MQPKNQNIKENFNQRVLNQNSLKHICYIKKEFLKKRKKKQEFKKKIEKRKEKKK